MDDEIRKRLRWVQLYEELRNAGVVCLECGISRPTLRKWWKRYQECGLKGLQGKPLAQELSQPQGICRTGTADPQKSVYKDKIIATN